MDLGGETVMHLYVGDQMLLMHNIGCLGHRHCRQGTKFTKLSTNILIILEMKHNVS